MAVLRFLNADGQWETADITGAVKYTDQELTPDEQAQARANISASNVIVTEKLVSSTITGAPQTKGNIVTIQTGNTTQTFETMPVGLYAIPEICSVMASNIDSVTLEPNHIYEFGSFTTSTETFGHVKFILSTSNQYDYTQALLHFKDSYRAIFTTNPSFNILHLPNSIKVPEKWIGVTSTLYDGYKQYQLELNTFYDITIENLYGPIGKLLTCNVDHTADYVDLSMPLIVTGTHNTSCSNVGGTMYCAVTGLSDTFSNIKAAVDAGRTVLFRFNYGASSSTTITNSSNTSDTYTFYSVELRPTYIFNSVQLHAHGTEYGGNIGVIELYIDNNNSARLMFAPHSS